MEMDLVKQLAARIAEWRAEAAKLHRRGFDLEGSTLSACAEELAEDLKAATNANRPA